MKKTKNRILLFLIAILLLPCVSVNAAEEDSYYDVKSALTYAAEHWGDRENGGPDQEYCAGFVSNCLIKGNITFSPETDVIGNRPGEWQRVTYYSPLNTYHYQGCWGLYHDLKARCYVKLHTLNQDEAGNIQWAQNDGHISKGDVIFYHLKNQDPNDTDQYQHVAIVSNDSSDIYVNVYAHTNARNNEKIRIQKGYDYICAHFTNAIQK